MLSLPPPHAPTAMVEPARRSTIVDRLEQHQERLRSTFARAAAIIEAGEPDTYTLGHVRWQALRELRDYQLFKHYTIFDPAMRRGGVDAVRAAAMKARCVALGETVVDHAMTWSGRDMTVEWAPFRARARALLRTIDLHMRSERADCARLAANA